MDTISLGLYFLVRLQTTHKIIEYFIGPGVLVLTFISGVTISDHFILYPFLPIGFLWVGKNRLLLFSYKVALWRFTEL